MTAVRKARCAPDPALRRSLDTLSAAPTERVTGLAVTRTGRRPGTAPGLVLVHGLGSSRTAWAPILAGLAERFDVLAVDLPGHGHSEPLADGEAADPAALADRVAAALQALDLPHPHLVGNSLGGWIGLELAAAGRLASLTALAPAGLLLEPSRPTRWLRLNRQLARATGRVADPLLGVRAVRRLTFISGSADPAALDVELARSAASLAAGEVVRLTFADGERGAVIDGGDGAPPKRAPAKKPAVAAGKQGDLF